MSTIQNLPLNLVEYGIIYIMLLISMIPVIAISRTTDTPERILYASSFGSKLAFIIITAGIFRGDWMIGSIGAFILIVGDAGMLILALTELKE